MLNALKAIIDLLKLRKDVKKTDLEIGKLEREQKKSESLIQPASFEDITKYDPATRERLDLARRIEREARGAPKEISVTSTMTSLLLLILLVFLAIAYVVY